MSPCMRQYSLGNENLVKSLGVAPKPGGHDVVPLRGPHIHENKGLIAFQFVRCLQPDTRSSFSRYLQTTRKVLWVNEIWGDGGLNAARSLAKRELPHLISARP